MKQTTLHSLRQQRYQQQYHWRYSYLTLLLGALQDALLDGALADELVDGDLLGLAEPVRAVHRLLVDRRVPVAVVEYHLQTHATTAGVNASKFPNQTSSTCMLCASDTTIHARFYA